MEFKKENALVCKDNKLTEYGFNMVSELLKSIKYNFNTEKINNTKRRINIKENEEYIYQSFTDAKKNKMRTCYSKEIKCDYVVILFPDNTKTIRVVPYCNLDEHLQINKNDIDALKIGVIAGVNALQNHIQPEDKTPGIIG
ncbi:hypothetical protein COEREDRAFT_95007 [Coemansia reversa NRRL 1564]|uniref:Uncharacterized protein n=1 Tax=Coemansia reversa (strain ATCC 12441 / NRRL 1564) TaxID=763665 RepID=A0A2G5B0J9_COERN|nr:hypothetical protein COEREDRAFT_95007 [Coemansia reversa NRRL 1564]|eukprot:PIA12558.1 hypothetical protein COEREDRAFT_95007 [Coemansia reversa NRRL 1564]